jgi:hypothetical protein
MKIINRIAALCVMAIVATSSAGCAPAREFGERIGAAASLVADSGGLIAQAGSIAAKVSDATIDPKIILIAANSFDAVQATAKIYLKLPRCTGSNGPVCRDSRATIPIINAIKSGRAARNAALDFVKKHPGKLGPSGLYDGVISSVATIKEIFATYNVGAAVPAGASR